MNKEIYSPLYLDSHALVVGINHYQHVSPLGYAINDAEATAKLLIDEFGFNKNNILLLTDAAATRALIIDSFLSYASKVNADDRIVFFFAGHGQTAGQESRGYS